MNIRKYSGQVTRKYCVREEKKSMVRIFVSIRNIDAYEYYE